jgi:excisionase family DNA binding protein
MIETFRTQGHAGPQAGGLLAPPDAARFLAVSPRTLWGMAQRGELPIVRIGRLTRYAVDDLRAYIARQTQRASDSV